MRLINGDICIREFQCADIPLKVEWINDHENNEYLHYDIPLEYEKTLRWYKNRNCAVRRDGVIEYKGIPVGLIGLLGIDLTHQKAELYISMGDKRYKRKGIGYCAVCLMLEYAFEVLGINKVFLIVDAENIAACRLYEKAGFVCEGYFKQDLLHRGRLIDRKRYAVLKEDFQ